MREEPWLIVDTETDGLQDPVHVVEIAAQRMRGWERDGSPFRILINHDVRIDPFAESLHGYSREYLRKHGEQPRLAHQAWNEYAKNLPIVAYNLSFDWNRALEPEYSRLGVPVTGKRGFCAMTLARRAVIGTLNYKLETLKEFFSLTISRSHQGRNDVETLAALFERVLASKLYNAGLIGFDAIAEFSRQTPVARCQEQVNGVGEPVWHFLAAGDQPQGPYPPSTIRQLIKTGAIYVWREGMENWTLTSELPDFAEPAKRRRKGAPRKAQSKGREQKALSESEKPKVAHPNHSDRITAAQSQWANELIGVCRGILADGIINTQELVALQRWLEECPVTHLYPISAVAELVEEIAADGVVTPEELQQLEATLRSLLPR
jgi:DNA polymerase III epsilon subunit-like protein